MPINQLLDPNPFIPEEGRAGIEFIADERHYHAAGAAHCTIYFKMLDDAALGAAKTPVTARFLLTTSFNLHLTRPDRNGAVRAEGRWISGRCRVLVAESRPIDADGEEIGRGTGTFQRSRIALSSLAGYTDALPSASP